MDSATHNCPDCDGVLRRVGREHGNQVFECADCHRGFMRKRSDRTWRIVPHKLKPKKSGVIAPAPYYRGLLWLPEYA